MAYAHIVINNHGRTTDAFTPLGHIRIGMWQVRYNFYSAMLLPPNMHFQCDVDLYGNALQSAAGRAIQLEFDGGGDHRSISILLAGEFRFNMVGHQSNSQIAMWPGSNPPPPGLILIGWLFPRENTAGGSMGTGGGPEILPEETL